MAARKSGLGRGLDALIPVDRPERGFAKIPVDAVVGNPQQPRARFDDEALEGMATSIRQVGVLQPIIVRPADVEGRYVLVAGERRWRAARMVGLSEIPAIIRGEADDTTNLTEALVENLQREDLSPLEEAAAYRQLMEDFGLTHETIAQRVGKSRVSVTNTLRLLQLPPAIHAMLESGSLSAGHARALLGIEDTAYAVHVAEQAAAEGWSVRQVEEASRARRTEKAVTRPRTREPRPPALAELEERLAEQIGTRVDIDFSGKRGKIVIRFSTVDDLQRIYKQFFT